MSTLDITSQEKWLLRRALYGQRRRTARQRAISECNLADGVPDTDVVTRLALHEELELAEIDSLVNKLYELT